VDSVKALQSLYNQNNSAPEARKWQGKQKSFFLFRFKCSRWCHFL